MRPLARGGQPSSDAIVETIANLIAERFSATPVLLAGFSYGGYLAAGLVRQRPEAFEGLFLACTSLRIRPEDRVLPPPAAAPPSWLTSMSTEFRDHLEAALGTRSEAVALDIDARLRNLPPADDRYLAQLKADGYPLSDEDAPFAYRQPVAIVSGRQDRIAGYANQFRALAAFLAATFTCSTKPATTCRSSDPIPSARPCTNGSPERRARTSESSPVGSSRPLPDSHRGYRSGTQRPRRRATRRGPFRADRRFARHRGGVRLNRGVEDRASAVRGAGTCTEREVWLKEYEALDDARRGVGG